MATMKTNGNLPSPVALNAAHHANIAWQQMHGFLRAMTWQNTRTVEMECRGVCWEYQFMQC